MKIVLVHPFFTELKYNTGGSEVTVQETYNLLKKHGHEVFFFATDSKPYIEENYQYSKYFVPMRDRSSILNKLIWGSEFFWNFNAQINFRNYLKEVKPDLVHVHVLNNLTYSILQPCFELDIPVVMTIHDAGIICPVRKAWDNNSKKVCLACKGKNVLPCIIKNCSCNNKMFTSANAALKNLLEKLTGFNKKIAAFVTPSDALKELVSQGDIIAEKITVIPPNLTEEYMNTIPKYSNNNYFVFVGALYSYKGVPTLLKAMKRVPKDIELHIVGDGNEATIYKDYVSKNNLNVKFLGTLYNAEKQNEYSNSIAVIVPSNYFEAFGIVNIEAMACGKPVIASNTGGIPEIIDHGKTGFLFKQGDDKELAYYIEKLWNNQDLVINLGKEARKKAEMFYSSENYYNKLLSVYDSVLKRTS